jgi:hypothetical protein
MTDELKRRMARLREIAPRLNATTDQASKLVMQVEKFLVDELHIGVSAQVCYEDVPAGVDDDDRALSIRHSLAFGRVAGTFRIHVLMETAVLADGSSPRTVVSQERVLWPSCSRETKLKAFEKLPELLDKIIEEAERLARTADDTTSKVNAMIGEEDPVEMAPQGSRAGDRRGPWDRQLNDAVHTYHCREKDVLECENDSDSWEARMEAEGREDADPHSDWETAKQKLIRLVCLAIGHDPAEQLTAPIAALTDDWLLVVSPGCDEPWDEDDCDSRRLSVVSRTKGLTVFS